MHGLSWVLGALKAASCGCTPVCGMPMPAAAPLVALPLTCTDEAVVLRALTTACTAVIPGRPDGSAAS